MVGRCGRRRGNGDQAPSSASRPPDAVGTALADGGGSRAGGLGPLAAGWAAVPAPIPPQGGAGVIGRDRGVRKPFAARHGGSPLRPRPPPGRPKGPPPPRATG